MSFVNQENPAGIFSFNSSIEQDIWKGRNKTGREYEWWYFDALSDDASEAIVIYFLDNFVFSPRYNTACAGESFDGNVGVIKKFPAVAFTYYLHGKPIYRSITEFDHREFSASKDNPGCQIGNSFFNYTSAPYGSGFEVEIDLPVGRNKRIQGRFEWLSIESDLIPRTTKGIIGGHARNFVVPRSDVTGRVAIVDSKGKHEHRPFRGTGYHDHSSDTRWMPDTIDEWIWGRAHFPVATFVFYSYCEIGCLPVTKMLLVRDGKIEDFDAILNIGDRRDTFGLTFPETMEVAGGRYQMEISKPKVIESSFFYTRSICEMSVSDGNQRWHTSGIAEYLKPEPLKSRWLRRLIDLRVGKDGKVAILP